MTTHAELVERAATWLRSKQDCTIVFTEMVTYAPATPDAIGWASGWSRLIEVKISRSDFFRDRFKSYHQRPESGMGRRRWYMTPAGLVRAEEVPPGWGLIHVNGQKCTVVVEAPDRELEQMEHVHEARILTSAIRRLTKGAKLHQKTGQWGTSRRLKHEPPAKDVARAIESVRARGQSCFCAGPDQSCVLCALNKHR